MRKLCELLFNRYRHSIRVRTQGKQVADDSEQNFGFGIPERTQHFLVLS